MGVSQAIDWQYEFLRFAAKRFGNGITLVAGYSLKERGWDIEIVRPAGDVAWSALISDALLLNAPVADDQTLWKLAIDRLAGEAKGTT